MLVKSKKNKVLFYFYCEYYFFPFIGLARHFIGVYIEIRLTYRISYQSVKNRLAAKSRLSTEHIQV